MRTPHPTAWLLALALPCAAQSALPMVTGKQVAARRDAPTVAATTSARAAYVVHCAGCHGVDGAGTKLGNVPDMRALGRFLQVPGGREFVVKVPGVMGSGLDDVQVADVTNWVLVTLASTSLPGDFQPYGADEVRQARATPLVDVAAARARLVATARERGIALAE
jgi:mono/diheme cytochrome c family protein